MPELTDDEKALAAIGIILATEFLGASGCSESIELENLFCISASLIAKLSIEDFILEAEPRAKAIVGMIREIEKRMTADGF